MYIVLIIIIISLLCLTVFMYFRTSRILKSIDKMLEDAINHTFFEKNFSETATSRIETKMHRYLTSQMMSQERTTQEKDSIKTLVSDISHQTKTPISNILLYTELLSEKQLDKDSSNLLVNVKQQADKLNFLIKSLIKMSRLENGIISVSPCPGNVKELIEHIDFSRNEKGVLIAVDEISDITAVFDMKWTMEAISNIVDNAVKYTQPGGFVTVSAEAYEMFVKIKISDTGIGMTEDETAKIFLRFYRSPRVTNESGVGIGLYLTREIISRQGGYIKVKSQVGQGSEFSVFLPKYEIFQK